MFSSECQPTRRNFLKTSATIATAFPAATLLLPPVFADDAEDPNVIGPRKGYSPQIGTLVAMMLWMRNSVLHSVKGMSQKDLDFLLDDKANSVGALLLHLAATDRLYQINTFEGDPLKELPAAYKDKPWT